MIDTTHLAVFLAAALVLSLTPGPAVLFIIARSVHYGRGTGIASAIGVGIGSLLQVCLAALGVSALLLASATAYTLLKWLGAAYLVYLGTRALLDRRPQCVPDTEPPPVGRFKVLQAGVLVNLLNPKTALFFLSFLPQFVVPGHSAEWIQTLTFGAIFVGIAACTDSLYALLSGGLRGLLRGRRRFEAISRTVSGAVYISLGIAAALTGGRTTR
jgi:threonine/homoserine/homoserine lactone efflux protein